MKIFNIKKAFKSNKFKYSIYSTVKTTLVLAILLGVNLAAGKLNIKKDLTLDKLYTLTEETQKIVNNLKNDTKLIVFFETGKEDPNISAVIEKYKEISDKLIIEKRDPFKQPQIAQKYSKNNKNVGIGTIVVEQGDKFKTISYDDFFYYNYGQYGEENIDSFAAEQQITNGIVYVNSEKQQVIYTLSGHGESELSGDISKQLEVENYILKEINLLQGNAELAKDSVLIISSPKKDISKNEGEKIRKFLDLGGRAAFFIDITEASLPNLQEILIFYGVKLQNSLVVEGQADRVSQSQIELLPQLQPHDIVGALKSKNLLILTPVAQGIEEQQLKRDTIKIEPILTSSPNSWAKVNLNTTTLVKESKDLTGPFNIAVAITDEDKAAGKTAKLVVVGSSTFMNSNIIAATNGANMDFVINSLNWLQEKKESIAIKPKNLTAPTLAMNNLQKLAMSGVVVIIIPVSIAVTGIIVWTKRRHS